MNRAYARSLTPARLGRALVGLGLVCGLLAAWLIIHRPVAPRVPAGDAVSRSAPSSKRPTAQAIVNYNVPAADPKYVSIPAIDVTKTRIIQLGITNDNQIAVPSNIYDTGWYNGSAKPGQSGAMFIYGHVSSWQANGVFYSLKKLKTGDKITVTRGDNRTFTYIVAAKRTYPYNQVPMNTVLSPIDPARPGLNLMTCTGQIIKGTSEFSERLVVFATLASS